MCINESRKANKDMSNKDLEEIKRTIKNIVSENTNKALLNIMGVIDEKSPIFNQLILLQNRSNKVNDDFKENLISIDNRDVLFGKINNALLSYVEEIELGDLKHSQEKEDVIYQLSQETKKKSISKEEAIRWLVSKIEKYSFLYEKDNILNKISNQDDFIREEYYYDKAEITKDGMVILIEIIVLSGFRKGLPFFRKRKKNIFFNIKDVVNFDIEEHYKEELQPNLNQPLIYLTFETDSNKTISLIEEIEIRNDSLFGNKDSDLRIYEDTLLKYHIHFKEISLARRMKNAFEFIHFKFGGKKEIF